MTEARYLGHLLEVLVTFLEGSGSVQGLSHAGVLTEERLAVVFYPVQHLGRWDTNTCHLRETEGGALS